MREAEERQAVFWCSLLRPVLYGEFSSDEEKAYLRKLSGEEVIYPGGRRGCPSLRTLKRKLKRFREGGFEALVRKQRCDRGKPRCVPAEVIATAVSAKRDLPTRSVKMLNYLLLHEHGKEVSRSTLYRHLKAAGATRIKLGVSRQPVRKRWSCEHTHDMWVGDFADGPYVLVAGKSVKTNLSAFIDVRSRYIVSGRYYIRQNLDVLCDTLLRGFSVHGCPRSIYLDNAKVYHSRSLALACYRLQIRLCHRPVRDPATGGVIERFFETVQQQYENEVRSGGQFTLEQLNQGFSAWLDIAYHRHLHSEIKLTPDACYHQDSVGIRQVDMDAVSESFLLREKRTVDKTFSDIKLYGNLYQVDPSLRGDRVEVRYDPFGKSDEIFLYGRDSEYLGKGVRHNREHGQELPRVKGKSRQYDMITVLKEKQRQLIDSEVIDFAEAAEPRRWPFEAFMTCLAGLLGLKGGLSAFGREEIIALKAVHARQSHLNRVLLKKAFVRATHKNIPAIVYQLQNLKEE